MLPSIAFRFWSLVAITFFLQNAHPYAVNTYIAGIVKVIQSQDLKTWCSTYIKSTAEPTVYNTYAAKTYKRTTTSTSTRTTVRTAFTKGTTTNVITSNVAASTLISVTSPSTVTETLPTPVTSAISTVSGQTTVTTTSTSYSTLTVTSTPPTRTARTVFTTYTTLGVEMGYNKRSAIIGEQDDDCLAEQAGPTPAPEPEVFSENDMSPIEARPDLFKRAPKKHNHPKVHRTEKHVTKRAPVSTKKTSSKKTTSQKKTSSKKPASTKKPAKLTATTVPAVLARYNKASVSAACRTLFKAVTIQTKAPAVTTYVTKTAYTSTFTTTTITQYSTTASTTTQTTGTDTFTSTIYDPIVTSTSSPPTSTFYSTYTSLDSSVITATGSGTTTYTSVAPAPTSYIVSTVSSALPSPTYLNYRDLDSEFQNAGDRLPDFSWAGYHASNISLPSSGLPATFKLYATGDTTDRTTDIQNALDNCKQLGGVIELQAGIYYINSGTISLKQSNCILRGSLNGGDPQVLIVMTGAFRSAFTVGEPKQLSPIWQDSVNITDDYVGVGTNTFNVSDSSGFVVGQPVSVQRTASAQWIHTMNMDTLVRNGQNQTWIPVGATLNQFRTIIDIQNNTLTVDVPLTDAVDNLNMYDNGTVSAYTSPASYSEIGIENLFIVAVPDETGTNIVTGNGAGVTFGSWVTDSWSRNIVFEGFNGPTSVGRYSMRITIANNEFRRSLTTDTSAGQAADVLVNGQQVLVTGALTRNNPGSYTFGITTGSAVGGPNVAFNCFAIGYDVTAPHQRWATGFLIDASVTAQSIFGNRGILGSGQGWVMGAGVNWNVIGYRGFTILAPPISMNFCVGCVGTNLQGNGTFLYSYQPVLPASLFVQQLQDRIGSNAASQALQYS